MVRRRFFSGGGKKIGPGVIGRTGKRNKTVTAPAGNRGYGHSFYLETNTRKIKSKIITQALKKTYQQGKRSKTVTAQVENRGGIEKIY